MRTCATSCRAFSAGPPRGAAVARASSGWQRSSGAGSGGAAAVLPPRRLGLARSLPEVHSVDVISNAPVENGRPAVGADYTGPPGWEPKSDLYLLRSDGHSCSRETVHPSGALQFAHPSSQQHLLVWKQKPKRVMVLKKLGDELLPEFREVLQHLGDELGLRCVVEPADLQMLTERGGCPKYVESFAPQDLPHLHSYVDFVVCLGGDGLLLHAASLFGSALPPVISFKLGSLGFLTAHSFADFRSHLDDVVSGCSELESCQVWDSVEGKNKQGVRITLRMRLECELWRDGRCVETHEVLNEVVLCRGANPYLSNIEVFESGTLITKVQADGVMLATPTGSTAYNVAAGGSMVHPGVPAILFTPICPHSLNFRPVILPDYVDLELRIAEGARCGAVVTFDGRFSHEMQPGESVKVRMSPNPVPTINSEDGTMDWFGAIQRCFQWSERVEQKAMKKAPEAAPLKNGAPLQGVKA